MTMENTRDTRLTAPVPLAARPLFAKLRRLQRGQLTVVLHNGQHYRITGSQAGPVATLQLHHPLRLTLRLLQRGDIGLAEGLMAGDWSSDELTQVLLVLEQNEEALGRVSLGRPLLQLYDRWQHLLRRNSLRGSRRNIAFHYDLGNDFYRLWLDPSMTYSAALFSHHSESLETAQQRKYQRILEQLDAEPGQHILEIGCGWGGFACYAAAQGYHVTGITLSQEQLNYARERVQREGLSDRVELRLQDYRRLGEQFDHIVSIEMFEAVGEAYWDTYFQTLRRCLKPGGRASLQVITIDDSRFKRYRNRADFIQKYIFPGGMLPSVPAFNSHALQAGLTVQAQQFYALDYARTLRRWNTRVEEKSAEILAQGFDERFLAMWRYYLSYCEAGFRSARIDLMQVALQPVNT